MIKTIGLLTRKDGWSHEQFMKHWVEVHGPLAHAVRVLVCEALETSSRTAVERGHGVRGIL